MSITNTTRPTPSATESTTRRRRLPRFGLSATQLLATALAAVTATFAASYFGVAGTVVGAAVVSVVTAAGKEVYSQSLRTTGHRVRAVVPGARSVPVVPADEPPSLPARSPRPRPAPRPAPSERTTPGTPATLATARWRRIAVGTMGVFVAVLTMITGVEIVAGRPVSDIVRGESGGGTSFFGTRTVRTKTVPPTPVTVTMTVTPKVVITTPTITRTAPASTTITTPTATPTPTSTPTTTAPSSPTTSAATTSPGRSAPSR